MRPAKSPPLQASAAPQARSSSAPASAWLDPAHGHLIVSGEAFATAGRCSAGLVHQLICSSADLPTSKSADLYICLSAHQPISPSAHQLISTSSNSSASAQLIKCSAQQVLGASSTQLIKCAAQRVPSSQRAQRIEHSAHRVRGSSSTTLVKPSAQQPLISSGTQLISSGPSGASTLGEECACTSLSASGGALHGRRT